MVDEAPPTALPPPWLFSQFYADSVTQIRFSSSLHSNTKKTDEQNNINKAVIANKASKEKEKEAERLYLD
jgi:hypothetical protein